MKKFIMIFLLVPIFLLTGCGSSNRISTEKSVHNYLKTHYPNENFNVQFYKDVIIRSVTEGCSDVQGHTWKVTSQNTGISFYVQDQYTFNSFTCNYSLDDNYFEVLLYNKIKEIGDSRIIVDCNINSDVDEQGYGFLDEAHNINLNLKNFTSVQDLARVAVSTRQIILEDEYLKNISNRTFWFNIYDGDTIITSIDFEAADNVNYIIEKISEKR